MLPNAAAGSASMSSWRSTSTRSCGLVHDATFSLHDPMISYERVAGWFGIRSLWFMAAIVSSKSFLRCSV